MIESPYGLTLDPNVMSRISPSAELKVVAWLRREKLERAQVRLTGQPVG